MSTSEPGESGGVSGPRALPRRQRWYAGLLHARFILIAAAAVLIAFAFIGTLSVAQALAVLAILLAAALIPRPDLALSPPARGTVDAPLPQSLDAPIAALLAGLPDAVIALDRSGAVRALNERAAEVASAVRVGEPIFLALRIPEVIAAIRRAGATGETQRAEFFQRVPLERWMEAVVMPLTPGSSELLLVTFHDLTPLRRVEEMRADFVANASHELRTPLAALSGFIETLQGPARDDAAARERFLAIMATQATRMARLIDDLLSLSRIELSEHVRPQQPVDLLPIVRQVADGLETLAKDHGVRIDIAAPAEPLIVLGDRDELVRAFENLVENALKYGASGKRVDIACRRELAADGAPELSIAVRDYGPGIAPEHLPRLTERFYRVDVAESRAQGGTGLGLALVKHILNRHRGRLDIDSRPGAGATFTARLPAAPPA
jgi:two-component system phosphate regulon sensor histidine kinase PhoR